MIRTKGEAGSGNIVEAVRHMRTIFPEPASPFVLIIAAPSWILLKASPKSLALHTNGTL
jgi:hypothetical protein